MPSTVGGVLIFVTFLIPGFLSYLQRRRSVPQRRLSSLVEVATFVTVSAATNLAALLVFVAVRLITPRHTPNVEALFTKGMQYIDPRVGYMLAWALALLGVSSLLAVLVGRRVGFLGRLAPVIVDVSAWYQVFEDAPEGSRVFVGCDLSDGTYVSGYLSWYNTDVDEVADRDLVLAAPITVKAAGKSSRSAFSRIILSAREITRLSVSYLADVPADDATGIRSPAVGELPGGGANG